MSAVIMYLNRVGLDLASIGGLIGILDLVLLILIAAVKREWGD